ncbi:MAG: hypothetical protein N2380_01410 [bacterium]|nr:hypothetical protein [bacterium]
MFNRVTFLIIISLVCISVVGTVILVGRFTREEYKPVTIPPPLPEIPKEEVKEVVFQYTPDVYRDPFKIPVNIGIAMERAKKEAALGKQVQAIPQMNIPATPSKVEPAEMPPTKEIKPKETKIAKEVKVVERVTPENRGLGVKEESPQIKVTGIIYDDAPFAIIEFEGKSGIFEEGEELSEDLIVKKINLDSVELKWKNKLYNIKLGG